MRQTAAMTPEPGETAGNDGDPKSARIRWAEPEDLAPLSEIAIRSKAHWGYDAKFMAACRDELIVPRQALSAETVRVAELDGRLVGFYRLSVREATGEIEAFFVSPELIGKGLGKLLWRDLAGQADNTGVRKILCQSDPNAEAFYRKLGFERIGSRPSGSIAGRHLPLLVHHFRKPDRGG